MRRKRTQRRLQRRLSMRVKRHALLNLHQPRHLLHQSRHGLVGANPWARVLWSRKGRRWLWHPSLQGTQPLPLGQRRSWGPTLLSADRRRRRRRRKRRRRQTQRNAAESAEARVRAKGMARAGMARGKVKARVRAKGVGARKVKAVRAVAPGTLMPSRVKPPLARPGPRLRSLWPQQPQLPLKLHLLLWRRQSPRSPTPLCLSGPRPPLGLLSLHCPPRLLPSPKRQPSPLPRRPPPLSPQPLSQCKV
mmetsp:Transcript_68426/g.121056  ORF Transcript_68426/g.121056 Transcript_68426/m.121056 type:complete len:248 (+) Transcript_68426:752-1495(+)